jgi:hypothetical protein
VLTLGLFNPLGFGIHARIAEDWGAGFDYQFLPSISVGDASASISLITFNGRWYPGGGSFFLAAGFALQMFDAEASSDVMGQTLTVQGEASIPSFMLGLGVMGGSGFIMGIDLALEIPLGGGVSVARPPVTGDMAIDDTNADLANTVGDAGDTLVELLPVLFQLNLLRIGYMF